MCFRLHFEARSPSPSSNFDYQTLPYIEHSDHTLPAAIGVMGHAPGNYQPISASELRLGRLPSSSEYREEALSFSTLPTSQFVLKPSSLAMDLTDQQHSLLMHNRSCVDATLEPYSWSWVRNARLNPLHLRRTTDHGSSGGGTGGSSSSSGGVGGNYHPHPSAAPTNYHHQIVGSGSGNVASSSPHFHHHQHAQGGLSSANEPRDISRSSLSVTSSKTIILSNAPVSHAPPTATPTPSTASSSSSTTSATASTASVAKTTPVVVPSKGVTSQPVATSQSQLHAQQLSTARRAGLSNKSASSSSSSSNNALLAQQQHQRQDATSQPMGQTLTTKVSTKREDSRVKQQESSPNSKAVEKKTVAAASPDQKSIAGTQSGSPSLSGGQNSTAESAVSTPSRASGGTATKTSESKSAADGAGEPMDTSSPSSSGTPRKTSESAINSQSNAEKLKSSDTKNSVKKAVEDGESSKALSAWMVGKPAASILQLSCPRKREREEEKNDNESSPKTKIRRTLVASAEAALLIASQFAQQVVKKEETVQPLTVTHALNSAVMGIAGARNAAAALSTAGLPMPGADVISHNITKIPLSLAAATASNLPAMQTAAAKLLALDPIQPLQNQVQQQPQAVVPVAPIVNSVPDGVGGHLAAAVVGQEKKAVVNAVSASGQAQALPATNLAMRRSSAGTNGTNSYQEILHSERVKQALAG